MIDSRLALQESSEPCSGYTFSVSNLSCTSAKLHSFILCHGEGGATTLCRTSGPLQATANKPAAEDNSLKPGAGHNELTVCAGNLDAVAQDAVIVPSAVMLGECSCSSASSRGIAQTGHLQAARKDWRTSTRPLGTFACQGVRIGSPARLSQWLPLDSGSCLATAAIEASRQCTAHALQGHGLSSNSINLGAKLKHAKTSSRAAHTAEQCKGRLLPWNTRQPHPFKRRTFLASKGSLAQTRTWLLIILRPW